jgi:hypothetical protein
MSVIEFQPDYYKNYKAEIGYPHDYTYLFGNKIKVHVPPLSGNCIAAWNMG